MMMVKTDAETANQTPSHGLATRLPRLNRNANVVRAQARGGKPMKKSKQKYLLFELQEFVPKRIPASDFILVLVHFYLVLL